IYYTLDGTVPSAANPSAKVYSEPIRIPAPLEVIPITLKARAARPGYIDSDVAEAMFMVNAAPPTPTIFPNGGHYTGFVNVTLGSAEPGATLFYTLDGSEPTYLSTPYTAPIRLDVGEHTLKVRSYKSLYTTSAVAEAHFHVYDPSTTRTADPLIFPLSGNFTDSVIVTMDNYTEGANIHFLVGKNEAPGTPTTSDPSYPGPLIFKPDANEDETTWIVIAIAFKDGLPPSNLLQRTYQVHHALGETAAPTFTPAPDTFFNDVTVTVATTTNFARQYITTDGSPAMYVPNQSGNDTPHNVTIRRTTQLRAVAKRPFFSSSEEVVGDYILIAAEPTIELEATAGGENSTFADSVRVTLITATQNATIRFTLDGSIPDEESTTYDGPFYRKSSATVTARSFKNGYFHSEPVTRAVTVHDGHSPFITAHPQGATLEIGGSVTLRARAEGIPSPTYRWQHDGADIEGATADSLQLSNARLEDAGAYRLIAENSAGADTSEAAILAFDPAVIEPTIVTHPADRRVALGGVITLSGAATGKPAPSYFWLKNGERIDGADQPELTLRGATDDDAGEYRLVAQNVAGADTSDAARLEIFAAQPAVILEHPIEQTEARGDTARPWVRVPGDPRPALQWLQDGAVVPGGVGDTLVIVDVTEAHEGEYSAIVMNVAGQDTSRAALLRVDATVGLENIGGLPISFALHPNYPNPFNPTTTISFDLPRSGEVRLAIYDLLGRRVMLLRDGPMAAGRYRESFDFSELASGVYL